MKRIQQIDIKNFKAFREHTSFNIEGKNVLVYGNNGSGKSSVFWALYTFLQSSIKTEEEVAKYFKYFLDSNTDTHQSLRNIFSTEIEDSYIKIATIDDSNGDTEDYEISSSTINTVGVSEILELNLSSDFINYKLLHNFFQASHRNEVNLWIVFERDIFPFLSDGTKTWLEKIMILTEDVPKNKRGAVVSGRLRSAFESELNQLNQEITELLTQITTQANSFLKNHFFQNKDVLKVKLSLDKKFTFDLVKRKIWHKKRNESYRSSQLHIKLKVELYENGQPPIWKPVHRVQSFLNEAMLTRIAIAIRIGALRMRPQTSTFKILVLDDMLISLDLSNRMDVVRIILNKKNNPELDRIFGGFQKIILTHDKGFFNLIKHHTKDEEWIYYNFTKDESNNDAPKVKEDLSQLQRAIKFFEEDEFENCGNELRKETETILTNFLDPEMKEIGKGFTGLGHKLEKAFNKLTKERLAKFKTIFLSEIDLDKLKKIKGDYQIDTSLDAIDKTFLDNLKDRMFDFLIDLNEKRDQKEKLIEETKEILSRIMNPASHNSENPLYRAELKEAIETVGILRELLK